MIEKKIDRKHPSVNNQYPKRASETKSSSTFGATSLVKPDAQNWWAMNAKI
jgi:hypothetical protein